MSTRAATVANSSRIKQQLVNLLFKSEHGKTGRDGHRKLDFASYSYVDLRNAYLKRIQAIHPDKVACIDKANNNSNNNSNTTSLSSSSSQPTWDEIRTKTTTATKGAHDAFIELQEAWKQYDKVNKHLYKGSSSSSSVEGLLAKRDVQENFTLFGVGCSFSDNENEKYQRNLIMDQASKGWFAAGQLTEECNSSNSSSSSSSSSSSNLDDVVNKGSEFSTSTIGSSAPRTRANVSLVSDELFTDTLASSSLPSASSKSKKSLVDHLIPYHKRDPNKQ